MTAGGDAADRTPARAGYDHYDVLVIGSGPGGATAAARVAETGQRVLLLERGDFLPRERDNWDSRAVFGEQKYTADETFYDRRDRPFRPELHYYVGGNSKVYGAALFRLLPSDFGEVQHPLLLKSATDKHPRGLANSSDLIGRNYMRHNNLALIAFSPEPNPTVFQKTLALNDFYGPGEHWEYPMGNIQMLGKSDDWQIKGAAPRRLGWAPSAPYGKVAKNSIDFWLSSEDIPLPDSRVTLRRDGAIKLALQPGNNTEGLARLRRTFQGVLSKLGMAESTFSRSLYLHKTFDAAATAHQAGTACFGTDPATSVLDVHCQAHDLDNLYVVDASFMPSIGAVNPTLTIIANALRVGDHIAERIGTTTPPIP